MASLQPVRGTHDLLPEQNRLQDYIANTAREIGELYGYHRMTTPIFEFTDVFARTLGDTSDVVTKEMVKSMNRNPIIFACANPDPEIKPELIKEVRSDAIIATGRSIIQIK